MFAQHVQRQRVPAGQRVPQRHRGFDDLVGDHRVIEAGQLFVDADRHDREVEPAILELVDEDVGIVGGQSDLHTRVVGVEFRHQPGHVDGMGGHRSDGHRTADEIADLVDSVLRVPNGCERCPGVREQRRPGLSQAHLAAGPIQQRLPDQTLETLDLSADRRLRHPLTMGSSGETAFLDHGDEVLQLT